jgi:uracil-DNA glycosylase family 4
MLTTKQIRMLDLLDQQIKHCTACKLHKNGRCKPFYTRKSKYVIIGEAPGYTEVKDNEPFSGPAGEILWNIMDGRGFEKDDFLIINSVNCRPVDEVKTWKNGKPTETQQIPCREWARKYIKVVEPKKILILGNYAMFTALGMSYGIVNLNASTPDKSLKKMLEYDVPYVLSVHPAYCIYRKDEGLDMLAESISRFRDLEEPEPEPEPEMDFGFKDFLEDEDLWTI